jgi:hypothetical protein
MDIAAHITVIGQEAKHFTEAARQSGLEADINTCPGWNMRDLVRHLSEIHLWAAAHVARRATKMWVDDLSDLTKYWPDLAVFWPDDDDLIDFYLQTNANLVRELESAPADADGPGVRPTRSRSTATTPRTQPGLRRGSIPHWPPTGSTSCSPPSLPAPRPSRSRPPGRWPSRRPTPAIAGT